MEALGSNNAQTTVCIAKNQHSIGLKGNHKFIAPINDITHRSTQIISYRIHINFGISELQVSKEHAIQIIVIVLPSMCQDGVKIGSAFIDNSSQANDLGACSDDNE